jgi:mono/diheme cytochrome c family protein
MDGRGVFLIGALIGAAALGSSLSCSAPDPGAIVFSERLRGPGDPGSSGTSGPGASSGTSGPGTSSGSSGDGGSGADSGGPDPVFAQAPAFNGTAPAGQPPNAPAKGKNAAHTGAAGQDPAGQECQSCHAARDAFGGTAYTSINGQGRLTATAQIVVAGPDGKVYATAYTDADGNFWTDSVGVTIPPNSRVGIRNGAGKKRLMTMTISGDAGRACNAATCHNAQNHVYLD